MDVHNQICLTDLITIFNAFGTGTFFCAVQLVCNVFVKHNGHIHLFVLFLGSV